VDDVLTGRENLRMIGKLRHLPEANKKADELLERFQLLDAADRRVATYSGGMRRRLDLAMSLLGTPSVIFLDEPTTGLDPQSRLAMWKIIKELSKSGITVFLTTQYLEEADELADRIAILNEGKIVAEGTPAELKKLLPNGHI
jgi:ABC-2 type transport system ATP-binding protein